MENIAFLHALPSVEATVEHFDVYSKSCSSLRVCVLYVGVNVAV